MNGWAANAVQRWRCLPRLVKARRMPKARFHDLRHIGATILLRAGVPMPMVSSILGHSSIGITVDTYGHVVVDDQVRAVVEKALAAWSR
jgi:integrase